MAHQMNENENACFYLLCLDLSRREPLFDANILTFASIRLVFSYLT
jgi:hypothetical protein